MADTVDREALHKAILAVESGAPLTDEDRQYVLLALRTIGHLAFYGYDAMRVFQQRQKTSDVKTIEAVKAMAILKEAIDAGVGIAEANALIQAREKSLDTGHPPLTETINYLRVVYGMTQGKAVDECASIFNRAAESVGRHYKRAKARTKPEG